MAMVLVIVGLGLVALAFFFLPVMDLVYALLDIVFSFLNGLGNGLQRAPKGTL